LENFDTCLKNSFIVAETFKSVSNSYSNIYMPIVAGVFGSFPKTIVKRKLFVKAFAIAIC